MQSNSRAQEGSKVRTLAVFLCRKRVLAWLFLFPWFNGVLAAEAYPDRFVWVFGWGLGNDREVSEISQVLETAGKNGFNGAVVSFGLDSLCKRPPDYFRRLDQVREKCEQNKLELIPSVFSVGYGGGALSHNRNLAEGLPVRDALFAARGAEAHFLRSETPLIVNGGFEEHSGNRLKGYTFHDQPGEVSFVDEEVKHGGKFSLRLENFTSNPHGHGRVMQELRLHPERCYRVSLWVKTEQLAGGFRVAILAGERELAPREFRIPATSDWRKVSLVFNSLNFDKVRAYVGLWGGKGGKVWLDDWTVEEVGPINVLHRPGTPTTVQSEDGSVVYVAGQDYAPLRDPALQPFTDDKPDVPLRLLPDGRIKDGQKLRVSWYHSMIIHESQVGLCMAEPALYEIYDHEAKLLADHLQPRRVLLNMDEVRMGGTCEACRGRNMAQLLGECVTRQCQILRNHIPGVQIYIWSDMFDPHHNARSNYYLVDGDFTGSWKYLPKDVVIAVWGGKPREKSLDFFATQGFLTLIACYYDADDLHEVKDWLTLSRSTPGVRGLMYTPWQKKYDLLAAFAHLIQ